MKQFNLNTKMLDIKMQPMKVQVLNPEYNALSEKEKKNTKIPQVIEKEVTVRDYLLTILGQRFQIIDRREFFWIAELGSLMASETKIVEEEGKKKEVPNDVIEISDDKAKFLTRIIENNKIKQITPTGEEREIELFAPFEVAQLLKLFEE